MENIRNDNLKQITKKLKKFKKFENVPKALRDEFLSELPFARLIVPSDGESEDTYIIKYEPVYDDYVNFCVFTDLDEFKRKNRDCKPFEFMLLEFENNVYRDILNLKINGYKIPMFYIYDAISRERFHNIHIEKNSHHYSLSETRKLISNFNNEKLINYLSERKRIQSYLNLFDIIYRSVLFTDIIVDSRNEDVLLASDFYSTYNIKNNYITVYTDLNSIKCSHFSVVDWNELIGFTLYYQLKGIKIDDRISLSRSQLLKHLDDVRYRDYKYNLSDTFKYIFRRDNL